jgi:hypothetical protein
MRYYCKNQERRLRVGNSTLVNGIDFLEVVNTQQTKLAVHFIHPLPGETGAVPEAPGEVLTKGNILILGGVRVKDIEILSVSTSDNQLEVEVKNAGDFSNYTLKLVQSSTDTEPPAGFDPQLASIHFSFKANCPSEFDCASETICVEEKESTPGINYLVKDYGSFRQLMLDRLSLLLPGWQERNVADLQTVLVELLAYTGDHLSYYQDAVATEAYLFKARKRISTRRHARLLDYHMHDGCNARAWVFIEVEGGSNADGATLPKGTTLLTQGVGNEVMIASHQLEKRLHEKPLFVFETKHNLTLNPIHNKINFYTWDDAECCLPRGATKATLYRKDGLALGLETGQVLIFEELYSPTTGRKTDADLSHRHAIRISKVLEKMDPLNSIQVVDIEWNEADALPFPLCISSRINDILHDELSVARGNIVLADHGRTVEVNTLTPASAPAIGEYRPSLTDSGITVAEPFTAYDREQKPASKVLAQDPHKAVHQIELYAQGDTWQASRDLLASDRFATEFVVETENDSNVQLRFGNDILGKKPGAGFQPNAKYRIGNGLEGNVGAEAIRRIIWDVGGILSVRNPMPAKGGTLAESMEEVRQIAPSAFRTQERAVTAADYAAKTELHPEVQKAQAHFRWTGSWYTVYITIDRKGGLPVTPTFKKEIYTHLEKFRMAGYDMEINTPVFAPLEIAFSVCIRPGYFASAIKEKLLQVFSRFDLAGGSQGFFHPDAFTFGQPIYVSALYQQAMQINGIESVELKTLKRWGRPAGQAIENGILQPAPNEIIRLDNDPNFPENGKITFLMIGGL